jgi:hypothetical protein
VRERNCAAERGVALAAQSHALKRIAHQEMTMPAIILWLLGVPLSVIILLYLIF